MLLYYHLARSDGLWLPDVPLRDEDALSCLRHRSSEEMIEEGDGSQVGCFVGQ
jgi:hypothetical protein